MTSVEQLFAVFAFALINKSIALSIDGPLIHTAAATTTLPRAGGKTEQLWQTETTKHNTEGQTIDSPPWICKCSTETVFLPLLHSLLLLLLLLQLVVPTATLLLSRVQH